MRTKQVAQFLKKLSAQKLKITLFFLLLLTFCMTSRNCYSQYVPAIGDRVIISVADIELIPVYKNAADSSQIIRRLSNGEIFDIVDKMDNWLKIQLSDYQNGWLHYNPDLGKYTLLKMGVAETVISEAPTDTISTEADQTTDSPKQEKADTSEFEIKMEGLTGITYQFHSIFDEWEINYYGLTGEIVPKNKFSYSGSLLFGKGSNDTYYLHLPVLGAVVGFGALSFAQWLDLEMTPSEFFLFFLLENFHYNKRINKYVLISPSITICGADLGAGKGGNQGDVILTNGIGIGLKLFPSESFMISSSIYFKHFSVTGNTNLEKGSHFGYTAMVNMGVIF